MKFELVIKPTTKKPLVVFASEHEPNAEQLAQALAEHLQHAVCQNGEIEVHVRFVK